MSTSSWIYAAGLAAVTLTSLMLFRSAVDPEVRSAPEYQCTNCNVILISIDTLGAKHMSLYNAFLDTTPFLQELSQSHTAVFTNAHAQAPWTLPSHASMLTGLYPWDLSIRHVLDILPDSAETLAEMLQKNGYKTAAFSTGAFVHPRWQLNQGFEEFHTTTEPESAWNDAGRIFAEASAWLDKQSSEKPFFLFVHSFHPHDPYGADENAISLLDIVDTNTATSISTTTNDAYRTAYRNEIREVDDSLKTFFEYLQAAKLLNNTIVIITSDHGEEFGEHGTTGFHSISLHSELLHVPLLITTPYAPASRHSQSVEIRSIPATILDITNGSSSPHIARSLLPVLTGQEKEHRLALANTFMERAYLLKFFEDGYSTSFPYITSFVRNNALPTEQRSVIFGNIHGIHVGSSTTFYDMSVDTNEQIPLSVEALSNNAEGTLTKTILELWNSSHL